MIVWCVHVVIHIVKPKGIPKKVGYCSHHYHIKLHHHDIATPLRDHINLSKGWSHIRGYKQDSTLVITWDNLTINNKGRDLHDYIMYNWTHLLMVTVKLLLHTLFIGNHKLCCYLWILYMYMFYIICEHQIACIINGMLTKCLTNWYPLR